jgi:hypothetical protein
VYAIKKIAIEEEGYKVVSIETVEGEKKGKEKKEIKKSGR